MTSPVVTTVVPDNLVGAGTAPREPRNIRAALVGAGKIAGQHLACLSNLAGVQVVGVCDLSRARAQHAAERFGVSESFTSFGTMLERCCPDVVHVTTPPGSHFLLASTALDAGAHVIVEKPAALTFGEVETLVQNALDR